MISYLHYFIKVPKKLIMTWIFAPAIYFTIVPLAFSNQSFENLIYTKRDGLSSLAENDIMLNFFGYCRLGKCVYPRGNNYNVFNEFICSITNCNCNYCTFK